MLGNDSKKIAPAAALLVLLTASGCSELHEYVIEGEVTSFEYSEFSSVENDAVSDFKLEAQVDFFPFPGPYIDDGTTKAYNDIIEYFNLVSSGAQLDIVMDFPEFPDNVSINNSFYSKANGVDVFLMELDYEQSGLRTYHRFEMSQLGSPFIDLVTAYPELFSGSYATEVAYESQTTDVATTAVVSTISAAGTTTSVIDRVISELDLDGDGIDDALDQCPSSDLAETVSFNWLETGVANPVGANGCSLMDRFAACEAEAEEQPSSPWGWFQPVVSGPTQCERDVIYGAQNEGLIDYTEGRMLRRALSTYYNAENGED
ncbi:hypothetical protein PSI9734_01534 [Pseudidiomarina piscicola]|uniref:Lipoprotein n=1 Tax=Pseudidiomarina piscicola TaxID=2614830 RepID=A0A6S6WNI1_9GAMM|nr:hypothetical protein [Pseudidiomarina piscicola]CAB0151120.1 hypothetical protein PSI9734_01534 [Pseudidiomarina piscicola]VZT40627.1 hypothetical protein PSI9734_01534 [Pseudomonas aeruginosa]